MSVALVFGENGAEMLEKIFLADRALDGSVLLAPNTVALA